MKKSLPPIERIQQQVALALDEDIGSGDLTAGLIQVDAVSSAQVLSRDKAVICGSPWFDAVFHQLDSSVCIEWLVDEGDWVEKDTLVCRLSGNARALLTGERTALNYLQTLSGTATQAARYVEAVVDTGVTILDTRKTIPGLRLQQKYATACGGACNHRMGLYDAVLIKENHIAAAGSIDQAMQAALLENPQIDIEIEVENLDQLTEALNAGATRILLDNFENIQLQKAVSMNVGRARLEASGNVTLKTIRAMAQTGVNDISIGAMTKHLVAVDFSMRFIE